MARVLVVYGTNEGQTRKIAQRIAQRLEMNGHEAHLADASATPPPRCSSDFDACIVGASVHEGKHQRSVVHFVKENLDDLQHIPSVFFSVSLSAAIADDKHDEQVWTNITKFVEETGWEPSRVHPFAGALLYTQYDFLKRLLMKMIAKHSGGDTDTSHDYEYTNWDDVDRFVDSFLPPADAPCDTRSMIDAHVAAAR